MLNFSSLHACHKLSYKVQTTEYKITRAWCTLCAEWAFEMTIVTHLTQSRKNGDHTVYRQWDECILISWNQYNGHSLVTEHLWLICHLRSSCASRVISIPLKLETPCATLWNFCSRRLPLRESNKSEVTSVMMRRITSKKRYFLTCNLTCLTSCLAPLACERSLHSDHS